MFRFLNAVPSAELIPLAGQQAIQSDEVLFFMKSRIELTVI